MTELNSEEKSSILIVDDSTDNIDLLIGALGDQYKVQAATDGNRALELVKQGQKPGLIFMDVMMPEMDGYEACKQIKSEPGCEDIDVIFVSALDSMENIIKGYATSSMFGLSRSPTQWV